MEAQRYDVAPELVDVRLLKIAEQKIQTTHNVRLREHETHSGGGKNRQDERKSD